MFCRRFCRESNACRRMKSLSGVEYHLTSLLLPLKVQHEIGALGPGGNEERG